jgi:hypothetical protein
VHFSEKLAAVLWSTLDELAIRLKLITITGDNAGSNGILCDALLTDMLQRYDNEGEDSPLQPPMRSHVRQSFIRGLAHIGDFVADSDEGSIPRAYCGLRL